MDITKTRKSKRKEKLKVLLDNDVELARRFKNIRKISTKVSVSEYHLTNACNLRCMGCWFYEFDFDKKTNENNSLLALKKLISNERKRKINTALIIGGEPTLFPERIQEFVRQMKNVTISTNGLKALPISGFENVAIAITIFSGGKHDDELRAIKPNGTRFSGLFDKSLSNYKNDPRVGFVYAVTEKSIPYIEETIVKIRDNGNFVNFNYYSSYDKPDEILKTDNLRLLDKLLDVQSRYPDTVISHPYYLQTMVTGKSHWGKFEYNSCPSISVDHPGNQQRIQNGEPHLPRFNAIAADYETIQLCCTSGQCDGCRDSQAITSWLLVSLDHFLDSKDSLKLWIEINEAYWKLFCWSPYHYTNNQVETHNVVPV